MSGTLNVMIVFIFNESATTEIYTYYTLFPYTTLSRSGPGTNEQPDERHRATGEQRSPRGARQPEERPREHEAQRETERPRRGAPRSEEHTSELQSLMRISYAVFCLKKKIHNHKHTTVKP